MIRLEHLLYLIIFLIPTYLIRFSAFGIPTNMLEVMIGGAFIAWLVRIFWNFGNLNLEIDWKLEIGNWKLKAGIFLFFLGLILGTLISPDAMTSLGVLKGWILTPLAFFIVARSVLDTKEKKEKALWSLALSGVAVAIIGFFYWAMGKLTFDGRLAAFYESPNMLAMYVVPALLIVARELNEKLKIKNVKLQLKIQNYLTTFAFALLFFMLLLTGSMGALIGFGGAMAFYFSTTRWGKLREKLGIYIFMVVVAVGMLLPFSSLSVDPWDVGRISSASRLMIWRASIEILKDHWLLGIGPGTFQKAYLSYQEKFPPYLEWAVPHPHNIFLTTWLYGGIAGLAGFLIILYALFQKAGSTHYLLLTIYLVYFLIHGSIDNTLWRNDAAMMFSLFFLGVMDFYKRKHP